jgi:hypothetical protein
VETVAAQVALAQHLSLTLQHDDLDKDWKRCSVTANFGAAYVAPEGCEYESLQNILSTVVNELLENAIKYSDRDTHAAIAVRLRREPGRIVVEVRNCLSEPQYRQFKRISDELSSCQDFDAALLSRLASADERSTSAGIGLLTLASYFEARLAFWFEQRPQANEYEVVVQAAVRVEGAHHAH